jgi:saccharopine dehydrogenase-like NADP-dependent oxidoreductase
MTNILILGAHGQIARVATGLFLKRTDARLTLYLRNAKRLKLSSHADRVRVVEGDVLDTKALESSMAGQDVAYANLAGQLTGSPARCALTRHSRAAMPQGSAAQLSHSNPVPALRGTRIRWGKRSS